EFVLLAVVATQSWNFCSPTKNGAGASGQMMRPGSSADRLPAASALKRAIAPMLLSKNCGVQSEALSTGMLGCNRTACLVVAKGRGRGKHPQRQSESGSGRGDQQVSAPPALEEQRRHKGAVHQHYREGKSVDSGDFADSGERNVIDLRSAQGLPGHAGNAIA